MKKKNTKMEKDRLRPEYNFYSMSGGVKGKYAARYKAGTNLIHLDSDVAAVFKDEESVNKTLRSLMEIAKKQVIKGV
jgi:hypothetical protein